MKIKTEHNMRKYILIFQISFLLLVSTIAFGYPADVQDISGPKYFPAVKQAIANAEKSVKVVMFIIELPQKMNNTKAQQLVDELINAKQRGVDVEVVLDANVDFVNQRDESDWQEKIRSIRAYKQLKDAGINVYYDTLTTYTHAKTLVIDDKIAIVGSTNWTESALSRNIEIALLVESPDVCQSVLDYLETIEAGKDITPPADISENSLLISYQFMQDSKLAPEMMKQHDERAFDVYLYLLHSYKGESITLFYDTLAEYLGIDTMNPTAYRRQLIKVLKKLDKKYKLIKFTPRYAKEANIVLLDYTDKTQNYTLPTKDCFGLPKDYFKLGWDRELSMRAKFCYLINLLNSSTSDTLPFWSKSVPQITQEFGNVDESVINNGMGELRRKRLIEVQYDDLTDTPYTKRSPNIYRLMPVYDLDKLNKELDTLKQKYGNQDYTKAIKYAKIVFEDYNPATIEDIILKTKQYGPKKIKKAFAIIAQKNTDNPKKTYVYVVGILENWGK
ncbi:MAG: hypothetical protein KKD05_04305 [Candidatus Omnitrophica bacterium]|nr:hypothetical protein [Candidatus Omnitrophota bacterium]